MVGSHVSGSNDICGTSDCTSICESDCESAGTSCCCDTIRDSHKYCAFHYPPCIISNNIILQNHPDTEQWWIAFYLENEDRYCSNTITNVKITDNYAYNGQWISFDPTSSTYKHYAFLHTGSPFTLPITISITKVDETLTIRNLITSFTDSRDFDTGTNFCTPSPTISPTTSPIISPTTSPSISPTISPTILPTYIPTYNPTKTVTFDPTISPSNIPTILPSTTPSLSPSDIPTIFPSNSPSKYPTKLPTKTPSNRPSYNPSTSPSVFPSKSPSQSTETLTRDHSEHKVTFDVISLITGGLILCLIIIIIAILRKCYIILHHGIKQNEPEIIPPQHIQIPNIPSKSIKKSKSNTNLPINVDISIQSAPVFQNKDVLQSCIRSHAPDPDKTKTGTMTVGVMDHNKVSMKIYVEGHDKNDGLLIKKETLISSQSYIVNSVENIKRTSEMITDANFDNHCQFIIEDDSSDDGDGMDRNSDDEALHESPDGMHVNTTTMPADFGNTTKGIATAIEV